MLTTLRATAPAMNVELDHHTPWELLVATILSAQCTDQRVNQVTPNLFRRYHQPRDYAEADPAELEALIRPTGFFKTKAKNLIQCAKVVSERFHGEVPDTMEALTSLPGVGRKTANVLLGNAFEKPAMVVDTHVKRVAWRLHLTRHTDPDKGRDWICSSCCPQTSGQKDRNDSFCMDGMSASRARRNAGTVRCILIAVGRGKLAR